MLKKKGVWNFVNKNKLSLFQNANTKAIKNQAKSTAKTLKIIKKRVHLNSYLNIINNKNLKPTWKTLERFSLQVGQEIVYLLLKQILYDLCKNKAKNYDQWAITIFGKVGIFIDRLQNVILNH